MTVHDQVAQLIQHSDAVIVVLDKMKDLVGRGELTTAHLVPINSLRETLQDDLLSAEEDGPLTTLDEITDLIYSIAESVARDVAYDQAKLVDLLSELVGQMTKIRDNGSVTREDNVLLASIRDDFLDLYYTISED